MNWLVLLTGLSLATPMLAHAADVLRRVEAWYVGSCQSAAAQTDVWRYAQLPLNHLGLDVAYVDLQDLAPADSPIRGVLWWVSPCQVESPTRLLQAALQRMDTLAVPLVLIGNPATLIDATGAPAPLHLQNELLRHVGLEALGIDVDVPVDTRVAFSDPALIGYERDALALVEPYSVYRVLGPHIRTHLTVRGNLPAAHESHLVTTGPGGGFVDSRYAVYHGRLGQFSQWWVNPFAFFAASFQLDGVPAPDPLTVSNRRVLVTYLDATSVDTRTDISEQKHAAVFAANVVASYLEQTTPALPLAVSLTADGLLEADPDTAALSGLRRLFQSGHAEFVARRSASDNLDPPAPGGDGAAAWFSNWYGDADRGNNHGSHPTVDVLPRTVTTPFTYTAMQPWRVGNQDTLILQRPGAGDMTGRWGSARLAQWLAAGETPRRVRPHEIVLSINHGRTAAGYNEMRALHPATTATSVIPRTASQYAAMVEDFSRVVLNRLGPASWQVKNRGAVQTVRFDRSSGRCVALDRSRGVVGQRHTNGALYVALDPKQADAAVTLGECRFSGGLPASTWPYLIDAGWSVASFQSDAAAFSFETEGYGDGRFRWKVPRHGTYRIVAEADDSAHADTSATADDGVLAFTIPFHLSPARVTVRLSEGEV